MPTMVLSRKTKGIAPIIHEISHYLESRIQQDETALLSNGYIPHPSIMTHDTIGVFAEANKYIAAVELNQGPE